MFQRLTFESVFSNIGIKGTTKVTASNFYCSASQTHIGGPLRITTLLGKGRMNKQLTKFSSEKRISQWQNVGLPFPQALPPDQSVTLGSPRFHFKFWVPFRGLEEARAVVEMETDLGRWDQMRLTASLTYPRR